MISLIKPLAYSARRAFLSYLPTLVLGTSGMKAQRSGIHHLATREARWARSTGMLMGPPDLLTTQANGRSSHRSSGTPITAASRTSGWSVITFSSSTDDIHSPPDL